MSESLQSPLSQIPTHLFSVPQYEKQAQRHLSAATWAYLQGGALVERTLQDNLADWHRLKLMPKRLTNLNGIALNTCILGVDWAQPMMLAPIAYQSLFHPQAELASAQAAQATQSPMMVSSYATRHFSEIAAQTQQPLWLQLYWQANRTQVLQLLVAAEQAGFQAVVLTVDAAHSGLRDRERMAGFQLSEAHCAVNLPQPQQVFANLSDLARNAPSWQDVAWLQTQTTLPILLKGILHPEDAKQALDLGIAGLIVSNHGGRVLDDCVGVVDVLPAIRDVCPTDYPILVDSGLRRGSDVFKALALGASAVLIGRPYIYGLSVAGALGVAHVMQLLQQELAATMLQCGCGSLADVAKMKMLQRQKMSFDSY